MDEDTRRVAQRLDHGGEGVRIGAAILGGLFIAFAISLTLLLALVLVARHLYGADGLD